jgi:hypothetical protein
MTRQTSLNLTGPLSWEDSDFWGKTSACRRFSIRGQTIGGKQEFVVWRRGPDGKTIPKNLGVFDTFEKAAARAEEAKYEELPKASKMIGWKSDADDWR